MSETIIVVVSIVAFVFLCTISARAQVRDRELLHAERLASIEKGLPVLPEPSPPVRAEPGGSNSLKTGLISIGIGLGIVAALRLAGHSYWPWGLVVVALGAGHLVYWFAMGKAEWEEARRVGQEATGQAFDRLPGSEPASGRKASD